MLLYPLLAVLIWSGNAIVCKLAAGALEPAVIAFYRWFLAWLVMTPFLAVTAWRQRQMLRPYLGKIFILALLGMALNQSLSYYAALTVSAINMGIDNALIPLMTIVLSVWLLREQPTPGVVVGGILSLAGLVWLLSQGRPAQLLAQGISAGDGMMLLAVFSYAVYGVLLKRWQMPLSPWMLLYLQASAGLVWLLPDFVLADHWALDQHSWPLVLYAAFPASLFATFCWLRGVQVLGANRTAIFMNLLPVFTAVIAILWLGESWRSYHLWGGGMTLAGVLLCQFWRKPLRLPVALTPCSSQPHG